MDFLEKNKEIWDLANFKIPTKTKYFFEINSIDDVKKLKKINDFALKNNLKILFIWAWTNIFFAFEKFDWIIIKNNLTWFEYNKNTKILDIFSWELISDISLILEKDFWNNLWHRFIGLPWTIAGAIYWNAWCFWLEIQNNFLSANVYNLNSWEIKNFSKKEVNFSYRNSIFKENWQKYFIINAKFDLSKKQEKYHSDIDNLDFRENKQPKWKTCWSFFKNPSRENPAWKLIELVWLKWFKLWGAFFSEKHANFLMSDGTAKYQDLLDLKDLAKQKVKEKFWINLEEEIRIIYSEK